MALIEVLNRKSNKLFHRVAHNVYAGDAQYIFPLESDIDFVFNRNKNAAFKLGDARRWVMLEGERAVGRIAAFYSQKEEGIVGGIGFFECVENQEYANNLFDTALNWLDEKGAKICNGPINFGDRDKFWGLMVEGFHLPTYLENYHKPYYQKLFENYGFKPHREQITFRIDRSKFDTKRFTKVAEWISRKPGFKFKHFEKNNAEAFVKDYVEVYNQSLTSNSEFNAISFEEAMRLFKAMKHVLVEEFIWFAYAQDRPIGVLVVIPDINTVLKPLKGRFNKWNRIRFHFFRRSTSIHNLKAMVIGVAPKFQGFGIDTVLVYKFYKEVVKTDQYRTAELPRNEAKNQAIMQMMQNMNAEIFKRHVIYQIEIGKKL
ncbi:MAG: GNAT family N-acetyltransferase [Bacteroidetes bacterium]|nr:GNAT family N-acetyltransferase [Bacteroidota bacterium]